tara:strand:- start:8852 stop:9649 length:798 start_codon:yes stop_codon:yes gene_type:complete
MESAGAKKPKTSDIPAEKTYEDPSSRISNKPGLLGLMETLLRSFRGIGALVVLSPIALIYVVCLSLALSPGIYLFLQARQLVAPMELWLQAPIYAMCVALGIIMYWLSILFIVPVFNIPWIFWLKPFKGTWYSINVIPWLYHNSLVQLVRYTTLDFICPSPLAVMFYRLMGMKIGKGTVINTSNISDPCLIELGDYVTVGGSATIFAHYGMKGYLIVRKVKIGNKTTIGLKASIMGDVVIGDGLTIPPHAVILPKSRIFNTEDMN